MTTTNTPVHGCDIDRQNIPTEYKWNVEAIFTTLESWQQACQTLKLSLATFSKFKGTLTSPANILACLEERDLLTQQAEKIYAYARLQRDTDNSNKLYQELVGQAETLLANYNNLTSFVEPELLTITPFNPEDYIKITPALEQYLQYLNNLQRKAQHVLPAREEEILAQSQLATSSAENIFRIFTGADLNFPPALDAHNQSHNVSEGSYLLNMTSPDRILRKNSFNSLFNTYRQFKNTLATSLAGNCRAASFYATVHNYPNTLTAALSEDNIPTKLYDDLITTIHQHLTPLHDYIALKKQLLNLDTFHAYDMYVPVLEKNDVFNFTYQEACDLVQEALLPLGPAYCHELKKAFSDGWVDVYENKGKRSGAYSWGVFGVHPYVLLNFQSRYNSVSTLAHELGHSMHSKLSSSNQPYINSDYTIFCAEVASTTNEILLFEHTYHKADKEQKLFLLNQCLETIRATVYRQVQFAEFERYIHNEIANGQTLIAENLEEKWLDLNRKYYGATLTLDEELGAEWSRIPHFYTPFYVYKYATGYSAANAFAEIILQGNSAETNKYLNFLAAGSSDYSLNILKNAGVDLTTPQPVITTLKRFEKLLAEFKTLI